MIMDYLTTYPFSTRFYYDSDFHYPFNPVCTPNISIQSYSTSQNNHQPLNSSLTDDSIRQLAPLQHGPERISERPPHAQHVDWAALFPNEVILHGPKRKVVAFTFDDGPDRVWTPRILDILSHYKIKATFMCVGERIQQAPQVFRRIVEEGHIVGNHTWSHPNLIKISLNEVKTQIEQTSKEI